MTTSEHSKRAAAIYAEACRMDPSERAAFLEGACAGDAALREAVEALLAASSLPTQPSGEGGVSTVRRDDAAGAADREPPQVPDHELLRRIGSGGVGEVWLARNAIDRSFCAIKVFAADAQPEIDGLSEYRLRVAEHANLVPILHVGRAGTNCYCIMPLADDAGTASPIVDVEAYEPMMLARALRRRGRMETPEVLEIGLEIGAALEHLHERGAHHGDVKPGNVLRCGGRWQLADHGLVGNLEHGRIRGCTPAYCPPEGPGRRAADLYALGVTLFELASGEPPDRIAILVAGRSELPGSDRATRRLAGVIRRACADDPADRFASATDMRAALQEALGDAPAGAAAGGRGAPRRVLPWIAAALVLLVGLWLAVISIGAPEPPLRVTMDVQRLAFRDGAKQRMGLLGLGQSWALLGEDEVEVRVELSDAAYCYLLALNPDGVPQLCYPRDEQTPPERRRVVDGPVHPDDGTPGTFMLTDGVGAQAFVVIASRARLPSYETWRRRVGDPPWETFEIEGVWESDGTHLSRLDAQRGGIGQRPDEPSALARALAALQSAPEVEAVHGVVFPVRAPDAGE